MHVMGRVPHGIAHSRDVASCDKGEAEALEFRAPTSGCRKPRADSGGDHGR